MNEVRLIDANALKQDLRQYFTDGVLDGVSAKLAFNQILHDIDNAPTVEAYPFEQVKELVKLNQQFAQEIENLKKPQGDLISREVLVNEFDIKCERLCPTCEYHKWNPKLNRYECEIINTAPTITPYKALHDELHKGEEE